MVQTKVAPGWLILAQWIGGIQSGRITESRLDKLDWKEETLFIKNTVQLFYFWELSSKK